jgi:tetratricopeptide (TPR) repeat protein
LQAQDPERALSQAKAILKTKDEHPRALYLMAQAMQLLEQHEEALSVMEKAIPHFEDPAALQVERLNLMRKTQGLEAALKELQDLTLSDPKRVDLVALMAEWLFESGKHEAAQQLAQGVLHQFKDELTKDQRAGLHYRLGMGLRRAGQLDQAIHHLDAAIQLTPDYLEAYLELGRAHQEQRAHGQALKVFKDAISVSPKDYRPYYQAGLALKEAKDYRNAETMLRRAAHLAPDEVSIHRLLGAVVVLNLVHNRRPVPSEAEQA